MNNKHINVSPDDLYQFIYQIFCKAGLPEHKAARSAHVLLRADLRGIDSHGIARLPGYLRLIREQRIDPKSEITIEHETPSTALVNAQKGIGLVTAGEAMQIAVKKAEQAGSGWVAIKNSTHFGIAAAHAEIALKAGMIGFSFTNASPLVAPAGGIEPMLGTNPVCCAIPAGEEQAVIIDMATTTVSNGKLEIAHRKNETLPLGWVQTVDGLPSQDPLELKQGGTLLPLGSELHTSSYKGFALGSLVDILTGVLPGANFGPWVPPFVSFLGVRDDEPGEGIGHFVGALRINAFRPKADFLKSMDQWIQAMRNTKPHPEVERVLIPGEKEYLEEQIRNRDGIPVMEKVYNTMLDLQKEWGISVFKSEK